MSNRALSGLCTFLVCMGVACGGDDVPSLVFNLGPEAIWVSRQAINAVHPSPTGAPNLEQVILKGPVPIGAITLTRPWVDLSSSHVRRIHSMCGLARPLDRGYRSIPTDERFIGDYIESPNVFDSYWVVAAPAVCDESNWLAAVQLPNQLFFCGRRGESVLCIGDILQKNYSAHFSLRTANVSLLLDAESSVRAYLAQVVKLDPGS